MRARNLKPGLFKNEILGAADPLLTILFEGLWCMADREGRLEDRPLRICAAVFPYRRSVTEKRTDKMLQWLHERGFIVRYRPDARATGSDQTRHTTGYIQVVEFLTHQNPHSKEVPSKIPALTSIQHRPSTEPAPDEPGASTNLPLNSPGLFSDSLIPSSLIPESSLREGEARTAPDPGETSGNPCEPEADLDPESYTGFTDIQGVYPAGIYRQSEWLLAHRLMAQHVRDGHRWSVLKAGSARYEAQKRATGSIGTQFVLSPVKFFAREPDKPPMFLEAFPLPAANGKSEPQRWHPPDYDPSLKPKEGTG